MRIVFCDMEETSATDFSDSPINHTHRFNECVTHGTHCLAILKSVGTSAIVFTARECDLVGAMNIKCAKVIKVSLLRLQMSCLEH